MFVAGFLVVFVLVVLWEVMVWLCCIVVFLGIAVPVPMLAV
jgi:hypothetical protein